MHNFRPTSIRSRRRRPARPTTARGLESLESRILLTTTPAYEFASLLTFNRPVTGGQPEGLVMAPNGDLYGIASNGGAKRDGTIFKIAAGSTTLQVLATFTGPNGAEPTGHLVLDAQGNLFGTTLSGGAMNLGTVFELAANDTTNTITTLVSFNGANGVYPIAGLVEDGGNLYGTTFGRGGFPGQKATVFEVTPNGTASTISVLGTFKGSLNRPSGTVVVDGQGDVFGTTRSGGASGNGSIFEVVAGSGTITTLASFKGTDGTHPVGTLLSDGLGNLFGITTNGGAKGVGTIFKYSNGTITDLATFNGTDGGRPVGDLIMDASGNFFGVASGGGKNGTGAIYELPAGTASTLTLLYSLRGQRTGTNPSGPLVMDPDGDFFGTTFTGGTQNSLSTTTTLNGGTVFELLPTGAPLTAARLVLTHAQPGNAIANQPLPNPIVVQIEDLFGNVVTSDNSDVTLTINSGPAGATIMGQVTVAAQNGIATFNNVVLQTAGTYTLVATEGPRVSGPTLSFKISADASSKQLVLSTLPDNPATSNTLTPAAVVQVEDAFGNTITTYTSKISWTVLSGPIGGALTGTTSLMAFAGKATFSNLTLSVPGTTNTADYTLQIAGPNLTPIQLMQTITL